MANGLTYLCGSMISPLLQVQVKNGCISSATFLLRAQYTLDLLINQNLAFLNSFVIIPKNVLKTLLLFLPMEEEIMLPEVFNHSYLLCLLCSTSQISDSTFTGSLHHLFQTPTFLKAIAVHFCWTVSFSDNFFSDTVCHLLRHTLENGVIDD